MKAPQSLEKKKKKKRKKQKKNFRKEVCFLRSWSANIQALPSLGNFRKALKLGYFSEIFRIYLFILYSSLPSLKEKKKKKKKLSVRAVGLTSCVLCRGYPGKYVRGISTAGSSEPRAIHVK